MNTVISFTPEQLLGCIIGICSGIITMSAAIGVLSAVITKVKKPNDEQNKRIDRLEERISEHDRWFVNDKHRLESIEDGNKVTQRAILALLDHSIDGNNMQQMKDAKDELQKYLIDR